MTNIDISVSLVLIVSSTGRPTLVDPRPICTLDTTLHIATNLRAQSSGDTLSCTDAGRGAEGLIVFGTLLKVVKPFNVAGIGVGASSSASSVLVPVLWGEIE